jgi:hypothetical protein
MIGSGPRRFAASTSAAYSSLQFSGILATVKATMPVKPRMSPASDSAAKHRTIRNVITRPECDSSDEQTVSCQNMPHLMRDNSDYFVIWSILEKSITDIDATVSGEGRI